jgi:hypothetical protein
MKKEDAAAVPPSDPADKTPVDIDTLPEDVRTALAMLQQPKQQCIMPGGSLTAIRVLSMYMASQEHRIKGLLKPLEFEYKPGRPGIVIRLGSEPKGWIPGETHFDKVRRFVKASGMDKESNVLLYHYAIEFVKLP